MFREPKALSALNLASQAGRRFGLLREWSAGLLRGACFQREVHSFLEHLEGFQYLVEVRFPSCQISLSGIIGFHGHTPLTGRYW